MSYFIEFGLDRSEGLYVELEIINKNNSALVSGVGIDHRFLVHRELCDYGSYRHYGQLIASNGNGLIMAPAPGVIAINVPPDAFCAYNSFADMGWYDFLERQPDVLQCKLVAVPADPTFTKTLFTGTISFGERAMSCPRIKLGVYPLYPNSATAGPLAPTVEVSQIKQQLAALGLYDKVEAAFPGPLDPATLSWLTGGPVTISGPLCTLIASALLYDTITMVGFFTAAAARPL